YENEQLVVIEITQQPGKRNMAQGKVIEVLGDHLAAGMEIQVAIHNYDIPNEWPAEVTQQIAELSPEVEESAKTNRIDLRHLPLVTIDGEDARDFDDAVYAERKRGGGWRLWVAIADVSWYVRPETPLDIEAHKRGNSVYFPEYVVPMLPELLSNGLCSLNPKVDRLAMVCEMTISAAGNLSGYQFYEAVIESKAR
ncbi:MAG: RNB domain-containing ribonuclease, partial [Amphritea sp.]|nr:RNB domain-containing ribonuclease [Amphritea sp.]